MARLKHQQQQQKRLFKFGSVYFGVFTRLGAKSDRNRQKSENYTMADSSLGGLVGL